jgi:septum formation protein
MTINRNLRLVLASASPRRLSLLRDIGLYPAVLPAEVDEREWHGEQPERYVLRLAESKCRTVATIKCGSDPPCLIVAADTAVVVEGRTLGKPADAGEAREMLRLLRGKWHEVMTGVFLMRTDDGRHEGAVAITRVMFRDYGEREIREYVASGEPMDKAGAYAIQGGGGRLAEMVQGSWSNVVGLPLESLPLWMRKIGVELDQLIP